VSPPLPHTIPARALFRKACLRESRRSSIPADRSCVPRSKESRSTRKMQMNPTFWDWWNSLMLENQIFYTIGVVSLAVLLLQMFLMIFGFGDHDSGHVSGHHDGGGFHWINLRTIMAFLVGFGWGGAILLNRGYSLAGSISRASVIGVAFLITTALLMRNLLKLQSSGTLDYANAVGEIGTVYSTIAGGEAGGGQLEVMIQGRLSIADARTLDPINLKPGTRARVVGLLGQSTLVVEPVESLHLNSTTSA
jgi:membrane protein implicated in regulation of membrane protease activity